MKFSYETQGANSYMVCEVGDDEELDSLSLGMITNNKIPGFVAALFTRLMIKSILNIIFQQKFRQSSCLQGQLIENSC